MRTPRPTRRTFTALLAGAGAALALGIVGTLGASSATPADFLPPADRGATQADVKRAYEDGRADGRAAALRGDDNGDGRIDEDETGWDCRAMGNRVCGIQRDASHTSR